MGTGKEDTAVFLDRDSRSTRGRRKMDAIHTFAREGELDNLLKCIESGVSVHLQDNKGRTPMHWAVDHGHLKIDEALLSRNADVNAKFFGASETRIKKYFEGDEEALLQLLRPFCGESWLGSMRRPMMN
ncbi:acyl-CoA-binding domain-containing protein 1 [Gossypium raimondii]|uniref:acyl-CoA-binding domain-containing protein 1 n=1 Tax=Gossypium raimondii TaxID=29730 RepID=UPI00227ADF1B|nr:acyl-CoA-binding domain-containing protein 1 [Gossypium raimondii]